MGVDLGGGDVGMAQDLLRDGDILAVFQEVSGKGVAQGVGFGAAASWPTAASWRLGAARLILWWRGWRSASSPCAHLLHVCHEPLKGSARGFAIQVNGKGGGLLRVSRP